MDYWDNVKLPHGLILFLLNDQIFYTQEEKMYIKEHDYLIYQTPTLYSLKYFFSLDNMIFKNY